MEILIKTEEGKKTKIKDIKNKKEDMPVDSTDIKKDTLLSEWTPTSYPGWSTPFFLF